MHTQRAKHVKPDEFTSLNPQAVNHLYGIAGNKGVLLHYAAYPSCNVFTLENLAKEKLLWLQKRKPTDEESSSYGVLDPCQLP